MSAVTAVSEHVTLVVPMRVADAPALARPAALPALYGGLVASQVWDLVSTSAALKAGAREANPVAAPLARNSAGLIGLKAASSASTIFFAERLWRKNRVAAVLMMAAVDGAMAAVAVHNVQNARVAAGR